MYAYVYLLVQIAESNKISLHSSRLWVIIEIIQRAEGYIVPKHPVANPHCA
jgi:hypothetical protein